MRKDTIVYRKVLARIALLGLSQREVADQLGVSYGTLHNKLCAATPFTLEEALRLKRLLEMPGTLEEAFEPFRPKEAAHAR